MMHKLNLLLYFLQVIVELSLLIALRKKSTKIGSNQSKYQYPLIMMNNYKQG